MLSRRDLTIGAIYCIWGDLSLLSFEFWVEFNIDEYKTKPLIII